MLGASAATQSSRCGRMPNEPRRVSAMIRVTSAISPKIREGRRILSCMCESGMRHLLFRCSRLLRFVNSNNHIETAFRIILELVFQNTLATIERVFQTHCFSFASTELLGSEKGLGKKPFESTSPSDHVPVFQGKLLKPQHGDDILKFLILGQRPANLLRKVVMPFARNTRGGHF